MDLIGAAGSAAVLSAGAAGVVYVARGAWRATRRLHHLSDDLLGDREAVPPRPGIVARIDRIDARLTRVEQRLDCTPVRVGDR